MRYKLTVLFLGMILLLVGCKPESTDPNSFDLENPAPAAEENTNDPDSETGAGPAEDVSESFPVLLVVSEGEDYREIALSVSAGFGDWIDAENISLSKEGIVIEVVELGLDEALPDVSSDLARAILENEPVLIVAAVPISSELMEVFSGVEIPVLSLGLRSPAVALEGEVDNLFPLLPRADAQAAFAVSEIWRNWAEVIPSPVMTQVKVAYAHGGSETINSGESFKRFLQEYGYTLSVEAGSSNEDSFDAANFLVEARFNQATLIYLDGSPEMTEILLRDVSNLAMSDFFVYSASAWAIDQTILRLMTEVDLAPSLIVPLPTVWWEQSGHPAILRAEELIASSDQDLAAKDLGYLMGLVAADITVEAIFSASDQARGTLTGEEIKAALGKLENFEAADGLLSVDFSDGNRGVSWLRLWIVDPEGKWMPIGDGGEVPDLE